MAQRRGRGDQGRRPLSRERVLAAALELADGGGIESLSMRKLAAELGGGAMSLYNHIANKEDLLDAMTDVVFSEIELPTGGGDWRRAMRQRAASVRTVLAAHRWAIELMQSRTAPGPATLRHHDAVIGCLRGAGFTIELTAHAFAAIDAYVYGFAMSERALPFDTPAQAAELAPVMFAQLPVEVYPHLAQFTTEHVMAPGYDYGAEYLFGLDLILDGLEAIRTEDLPGRTGDQGPTA